MKNNNLSNLLRPRIKNSPELKILIPIGGLFDLITGTFLKGVNGRWYLNGGLPTTVGIVGKGNLFKSTIMNYMMLSAASRVNSTCDTSITTYDTEVNIHWSNLKNFASQFKFQEEDILSSGLWQVSDKNTLTGEEYDAIIREHGKDKIALGKKILVKTMFLDKTGKKPFEMYMPTFHAVDSLTEFDTSDVTDIRDKAELGTKDNNMLFMRQGLAKTHFLKGLPKIAGTSNTYILTTAHVGKDSAIQTGPGQPMPDKKLAAMRMGDKIKGVTDSFFFLLGVVYQVMNAKPLTHPTTKAPIYPMDKVDNNTPGNDLYLVALNVLRNKSGPSNYMFEIIVSQKYGVLPTLSEFHFIKENGRFGLVGNVQNYVLALRPDVKLSRTRVRGKIDSDPLLRRAINITSELLQLHMLHRASWGHILCDPEVLYNDIKEKGYDWDKILKTIGYPLLNDKTNGRNTLSIIDLLLIRKGELEVKHLKLDKGESNNENKK